ncbi:MAG: D-glycero-beta-D-manno-heptose-7-phosphate kinase [Desulfovibrionaceae bacterium]|nr:D-glycero-beta-D-manno-heptose-7-phosphate kinase [Desulfovibrionaceae bacterium]
MEFKNNLLEMIQGMSGRKVMIIGDVMIDQYVVGEVDRISPEAPVPVVRVQSEHLLAGGAGNVARNIASLGGRPSVYGLIGGDPGADQLRLLFEQSGVEARLLRDPARPTTRKTRVMAGGQQIVRVDRESSAAVDRARLDQLFDLIRRDLPGQRVVILSDYGKGLVSKAFMDRLRAEVQAQAQRPLILVDPKLRNFKQYKEVDILTPNKKETQEGSGVLIEDRRDIIRAGLAIFKALRCRNLLVTLGGEGMALFLGPGKVVYIPTIARKVFDVTGAGDTVIATLGLALAAGADLLTAGILANYAAGVVVGQVGAAAAGVEDLSQAVASMPRPEVCNWLG